MEWSPFHARLHLLLRKKNLLPKNSRILMAVSGGQDSLCLARLLIDLQPKWQWSLGLVHCDHCWREDSDANAEHVLSLAKGWNIPAWQRVADISLTSEAAAREWRYEQFGQVARAEEYLYIVTGHTTSDRAETVLYNLLRGTGTDGLGTLNWVRSLTTHDQFSPELKSQRPIQLVRPLLEFTRQDTADFCEQAQLPIWEDSSNQDLNFRRNRIRQELMPYLRSHFNPQVEKALAQMAEITAADTAYLATQTEALYREIVSPIGAAIDGEGWEVQRSGLVRSPIALQRRVVRQLLQKALTKPPNFEQIEKMCALASAPNGTQTDPYPGGWIAKVNGPLIQLTRFMSK
ncbi:MAG: tRNA lysidine(34) synthetase TilS [Cyanobacteria bacterium P01_C01_bin.69]